MEISANLSRVRDRIAASCERSGRLPGEITLVAITKNVALPGIKAALEAGLTDLGENRIQEALDKMACMEQSCPAVTWHMVGRLQENKARKAAQYFDIIHSVDSVALAGSLSRLTPRPLTVLLQVNVAGESSKAGVAPADAMKASAAIAALPNLRLAGLMTIAPAVPDPEQVRPVFRRLRELRDALGLVHLSMGMTDDFEVAVEEGATMVRIGRAIFSAEAQIPLPSGRGKG